MTGVLTAYDGQYAAMLVPWSQEHVREEETGKEEGQAVTRFENQFYAARLRIEKLDSVTHENLLQTNPIYREIYEAQTQNGGDFDQPVPDGKEGDLA